jgi:hypothetical protein
LEDRVRVQVLNPLQVAVRVAVLGVIDPPISVLVFADCAALVGHTNGSLIWKVLVLDVVVLDHQCTVELPGVDINGCQIDLLLSGAFNVILKKIFIANN